MCKYEQKLAKKNGHFKSCWTLLKNVHLQGPCSLKLCSSGSDCISFNLVGFFQLDLLDPKGRKIMASCFDPTFGGKDSMGWCATCDAKAKRGERGYCGPGETNSEEDAPIIYQNSTNWGFCDNECSKRSGDETMLQVREHL